MRTKVTVLSQVCWTVSVLLAGLALQETLLLTLISLFEMKEAFLVRAGEVRSEQVSELEVLWLDTDQEDRSSDRGLWDFMVTLRSRVETRYCIVSSSGSDLW